MAKFETKVVMTNECGEVVFELVKDGMFYKLPTEASGLLLDIGDVYKVEEIETEVE